MVALRSIDKVISMKVFPTAIVNVDSHFAKNIEYLLCAQYATDIKQIQSNSNLTLHLTHGKTLGGRNMSNGMLKNPDVLIVLYELSRHINS